jgi:hypothetical protein
MKQFNAVCTVLGIAMLWVVGFVVETNFERALAVIAAEATMAICASIWGATR